MSWSFCGFHALVRMPTGNPNRSTPETFCSALQCSQILPGDWALSRRMWLVSSFVMTP